MIFSINEINDTLGSINWLNTKKEILQFKRIIIDSRKLLPEDLFIAIKGNNFDGHNFLMEVLEKGIKAVVIKEGMQNLVPTNIPYWIVPNTLEAFQKLALLKRKKLNIPLVAITGSVGKTTTKEMTGEILKRIGKVKISLNNNNNEIGMGLTILECNEDDRFLVVEMGMRGEGQIENLSKFSEPDIGVITNIGSSHIGILGTKENIARAKCEIIKHLNPNGLLIIPYGEDLIEVNLKKWKGRIVRVKVLYIDDYDININFGEDIIVGYYNNLKRKLIIENKIFEISSYGFHNAQNFLFAYVISRELGLEFRPYNKFNFKSLQGRNKIIKTNKITIMDETYNASPESFKACLEVLLQYPGRHFLVLGSMKELGRDEFKYHQELLEYISEIDIKGCVFLNDFNEDIIIKFSKLFKNKVIFINDISQISKIINNWTMQGDYLLIKGSRYWQLEKIIPLID